MKKHIALSLAVGLASVLLAGAPVVAQEAEEETTTSRGPSSVYRLDFVVYEKNDGAVTNTRRYSMVLENKGGGETRTISIVPVRVGPVEGGFDAKEVSVEIRAQVREQGEQVLLQTQLNIQDFAAPESETADRPVSRHIFSRVSTAVELDTPTIVSTVDEAASRRRFELEVTVTRVR